MAIINVFPGPGTPIQSAVTSAVAGDLVLVHSGTYAEGPVTVATPNVIVVAKNEGTAVREGGNAIANAFIVTAVGVEINGFVMQNYTGIALNVTGGGNSRLVGNTITNALGGGISVSAGIGHLLWRNNVQSAGGPAGINITAAVTNSWLAQNVVGLSVGTGIILAGANNALFGNVVSGSATGIASSGINNFLYGNTVQNSGAGGIVITAANPVLLRNLVDNNGGNGIGLTVGGTGYFGSNDVEQSTQAGISVATDFNSVEFNELELNQNFGLVLAGAMNSAFGNRFVGNQPTQLSITGTDNNVF